MGWLSSLFGSSSATDKILDGVVSGVDAMFFTEEEKHVANQKILDFKLSYAKATTGQNVARRLIAMVVTVLWCTLIVLMIGARAFSHEGFSSFVYDVLKDNVSQPFSIIIGFYFLSHIVGKLKT